MALGMSAAAAAAELDAHMAAYPWIQLHTGDPGAAGTANIATESARLSASMAAASTVGSNAQTSLDTQLDWEADAAETYTHFTRWSASTAGNFGSSGTLAGNAVGVGDDVKIAVGGLVATKPIAT